MPLTNKLFALTGAASGIGLSTARILARRGAYLSLADANKDRLSAAHSELSSLSKPTNILSTPLDVRNTASINTWISNTVSHFKQPLSGAANIAGIHPLTACPIHEMSDAQFEDVMAVNTFGLFKCLRAQLQPGHLIDGGSIVNIGSVSGLIGFAGDTAYVASKHAVHGITKAVSKEVGARGIRVNTVAPGQTNTPMVDAMKGAEGTLPAPPVSLKREGQPEEIAELIVWLLSQESSYVTGTTIRVDGGMLE